MPSCLQFKAVDRMDCFQRCLEVLKQRVKTENAHEIADIREERKKFLKKSTKGLVI